MFDSSMYNLSNPMMTEDIGLANLDRTLPMAPGFLCGYVPGITGSMDNIKLQGPLTNDELLITQKQKDKKAWKTVFSIAGLALAVGLGVKYGKKGLSACWNAIKNVFSKIKPKKP